MAKKQQKNKTAQPRPAETAPRTNLWIYAGAALGAFLLVVVVYWPALGGSFVFDDFSLPFLNPALAAASLGQWIGIVRPLTYFTYWVNYQIGGAEPASYHWLNLLLHFASGVLVAAIARRLLEWSGTIGWTRDLVAAFCGLLFLVHPLQTEAVSYVSSRSEVLAVFLLWAALGHFVYRRRAEASWYDAAVISLLFLLALVSKEYSAVLPALLLLADAYWGAGWRSNWRLYLPLAAGALAGAVFVTRVLAASNTAGFGTGPISPAQYFLSQCRVIWIYLAKFLLPVSQTIDYDFTASTGPDFASVLGLTGLAAATIAAVIYRRKYPLASYGWLAFLILIAPTSSIIPINDMIVERRVYLPSIGLLLIAAEFLRRMRWTRQTGTAALAAVVLVYGLAAYKRNEVWSSSEALWTDAVAKAPAKSRPHFQLARVLYGEGRFAASAAEYQATAKLSPPDYTLLLNWGLALDDGGQTAEALEKLRESARLHPSAHVFSQIARVHGRQGKNDEALDALNTAEKLDPRFEMTYVYRGNVFLTQNNVGQAMAEYNRALALNPNSGPALEGLRVASNRH